MIGVLFACSIFYFIRNSSELNYPKKNEQSPKVQSNFAPTHRTSCRLAALLVHCKLPLHFHQFLPVDYRPFIYIAVSGLTQPPRRLESTRCSSPITQKSSAFQRPTAGSSSSSHQGYPSSISIPLCVFLVLHVELPTSPVSIQHAQRPCRPIQYSKAAAVRELLQCLLVFFPSHGVLFQPRVYFRVDEERKGLIISRDKNEGTYRRGEGGGGPAM